MGVAEDLDVSASKVDPFSWPELGHWLARPADFDAIIWWRLDMSSAVSELIVMVFAFARVSLAPKPKPVGGLSRIAVPRAAVGTGRPSRSPPATFGLPGEQSTHHHKAAVRSG
ncbi:hypothetical protein GCM10009839_55340 [Catenulispora yoronensis]|uniref:Uncharacterized protein n=1 Tax=Catenulispora yoronensis TaxID=450799 RepID=A0ABN2UWY4_9ACTN